MVNEKNFLWFLFLDNVHNGFAVVWGKLKIPDRKHIASMNIWYTTESAKLNSNDMYQFFSRIAFYHDKKAERIHEIFKVEVFCYQISWLSWSLSRAFTLKSLLNLSGCIINNPPQSRYQSQTQFSKEYREINFLLKS